jgi:hypothetical protein
LLVYFLLGTPYVFLWLTAKLVSPAFPNVEKLKIVILHITSLLQRQSDLVEDSLTGGKEGNVCNINYPFNR